MSARDADDESADPATAENHGANGQNHEPPRRRRPGLAWLMLVAGAVMVLGTAWVGWRTYQAYRDLQSAAVQVSALQRQFDDVDQLGPADARQPVIASLQADAASARSAVEDPVFRLATGVPWVGPNLDAIRQVSLTVDSLSTDVIPSLDDIAQTLDPAALAPKDGAIDLAPIVAIGPRLQQADAAVQDARARLGQIDKSSIVAPVGDAVSALQAKLDAAADLTDPAARIARLLPAALGADGPRTYLVVFQNLAEPRATGGIFGSYAVVTADQGKVTIVDQAPARSMKFFEPPVGGLSDDQQRLFGSEPATFPADVNLTPDFPTAARLFIEMYQARGGGAVDGVLAIDPVALSYLMKGAPALNVDGVSIDAGNVVATLLSDAYQRFDDTNHDRRDDFLAGATTAAFAQISSGATDPHAVVAGVRKAAGERRLLYYSTHPDEQTDLSATGLSGALNGPTEAGGFGVFLNDAVASKLGYYLTGQATVTAGECQPDGSTLGTVTATLNYQPPPSGLPSYVSGSSADYSYRTHVLLVAPTGGSIDAAFLDDRPVSLQSGTDGGRSTAIAVVELTPGSRSTVSFHVSVPPGSSAPTLTHTPTVEDWSTTVQGFGACGS